MTAAELDKTVHNYFSAGKYRYYSIPTPTGIVPSEFAIAPLSLADARATLADIHAHSPDYKGKALEEFQEVLKLDPDNAKRCVVWASPICNKGTSGTPPITYAVQCCATAKIRAFTFIMRCFSPNKA
jgi:hypothetical protein